MLDNCCPGYLLQIKKSDSFQQRTVRYGSQKGKTPAFAVSEPAKHSNLSRPRLVVGCGSLHSTVLFIGPSVQRYRPPPTDCGEVIFFLELAARIFVDLSGVEMEFTPSYI